MTGSIAERQGQVQSRVLPLTLPMPFGYVLSLNCANAGSASAALTKVTSSPRA